MSEITKLKDTGHKSIRKSYKICYCSGKIKKNPWRHQKMVMLCNAGSSRK
jgi:hypothetical protein